MSLTMDACNWCGGTSFDDGCSRCHAAGLYEAWYAVGDAAGDVVKAAKDWASAGHIDGDELENAVTYLKQCEAEFDALLKSVRVAAQ